MYSIRYIIHTCCPVGDVMSGVCLSCLCLLALSSFICWSFFFCRLTCSRSWSFRWSCSWVSRCLSPPVVLENMDDTAKGRTLCWIEIFVFIMYKFWIICLSITITIGSCTHFYDWKLKYALIQFLCMLKFKPQVHRWIPYFMCIKLTNFMLKGMQNIFDSFP